MNLDPTTWRPVAGLESLAGEELAATPAQKRHRPCAHCGRVCGTPEAGFASLNGAPFCHPEDASTRPDCYRLVSYEHHDAPCPGCWVP
jgi:hypothetical protein